MCIDSDVRKWLHWFFGLTHLPPDKIYEDFVDLLHIASIEAESFLEYLLDNYVRDNSQFPPPMWATEPSDNPRTTNAVESFNSHYNGLFYHPHPNVHLVVDALLGIQASTTLLYLIPYKADVQICAHEHEGRCELMRDTYARYRSALIR